MLCFICFSRPPTSLGGRECRDGPYSLSCCWTRQRFPSFSLPYSQFLNFLPSPFIVIMFFIHRLVLVTMHVCALSVALLGLVALIDTSPCPEVIKSSISYGSYGRDKTLPAIYKTLTSCPGVRALDLQISQGGCVHSLDDPWSFKFSRRDRFPSLKSLSLEGYHFDDTEATLWQKLVLEDGIWYSTWEYLADMTGVNALRPYEQPIESHSASNLDQWRLAMDWTQLQTLEIADTDPRFLRKMTGQMPVLQSLKLSMGWTEGWCDIANQTSRLLAALPSLSSLSLHGYMQDR